MASKKKMILDDESKSNMAKMVSSTLRDVYEEAFEISVLADSDYFNKRRELFEEAKKEMDSDFIRRVKQIETEKSVHTSGLRNKARLELLSTKYELTQDILLEAREELGIRFGPERDKNKEEYTELIFNLLKEAFSKLEETKVVVRCREKDLPIIESVFKRACEEYAVEKPDFRAEIDRESFLGEYDPETKRGIVGGVVVGTDSWSVAISNTLDSRLILCYERNLPKIRELLWGNMVD